MAATNLVQEKKLVPGTTKATDSLVMEVLGKAGAPMYWGDVETAVLKLGGDMPFDAFRTLYGLGYIERADAETRMLHLTDKGRAAYEQWTKAKA